MILRYLRTKFCRHLSNLLLKIGLPVNWLICKIPDDNDVCRHIIWKYMYNTATGTVDPRQAFQFQDKDKNCLSVSWRKFAPAIGDVDTIGFSDVAERNKTRQPEKRQIYMGFRESVVRPIRSLTTVRGHTVKVVHAPTEGCHHAHLEIVPAMGVLLQPNDKRDISDELWKCFSKQVDFHSAASDAIRIQLN